MALSVAACGSFGKMSPNEEQSISTAVLSQIDTIIWDCLRHCVTGESVSVDGEFPAALIDRARNYNLLPIIAAALPDLPPDIRQPVSTAARQRRIRTLIMTQEMLRVVAACAKADIRIVPLKGVALANTVYSSPTLRFFDDLDLLIEPGKLDAALAIIHQLGYAPHERGSADWHHAPPQTHPKHGTTIELHSDVMRRFGHEDWSLTDIWSRVERKTIQGQAVELLSADDALIHIALHARHHLFEKPTFLLDTAMLLRQKELGSSEEPSSYQWAQLIRKMTAAGALVPFAHLVNLLVLHQLIAPLPSLPVAGWRLTIARRVHRWEGFDPRSQRLRYGTLPKLIELLLMDSFEHSAIGARTLLWPDAEFVGEKYGSQWERLGARLTIFKRQLLNR